MERPRWWRWRYPLSNQQPARKYSRKLPIDYFHSNIPSANITNNIGIRKARDKYALILTAGDDVDFIDEYFKEMAEYFNKKHWSSLSYSKVGNCNWWDNTFRKHYKGTSPQIIDYFKMVWKSRNQNPVLKNNSYIK